ncbi:lipase 1-like [Rhipicephalus sanguineus]|uniref:lipase 1-like n=1 Tax=Rhipicephalus sanguineus TaxID=34632 RepID=UPI0020C3C6C3|nr:lipase 1-like [Rhipicephalus sanguineus]
MNFQVTVKSMASMTLIVDASYLTIGGERIPVVPVGPQCELIRFFGFSCETTEATTDDGYVIEVDRSAGFLLAQRGYDVWSMNTREIAHRSRHKTMSQKDDRYWQWSFDEIGRYDIAAVIDLVLNVTGRSKVTLLVFSQGTAASLILLSTRPEYNEKKKPPAYDVDRITVKIALFSSEGDTVAEPKDVSLLAERLGSNLLFRYVVPRKDFRHLDFCWGYQATDIVHDLMLDTIEKYSGTST